jgi:hypothetical protein
MRCIFCDSEIVAPAKFCDECLEANRIERIKQLKKLMSVLEKQIPFSRTQQIYNSNINTYNEYWTEANYLRHEGEEKIPKLKKIKHELEFLFNIRG